MSSCFFIIHESLFLSVPNVKFNHRRAGEQICVSMDGRRICADKCAFSTLGDHFPGSARRLVNGVTVLINGVTVLGMPLLVTGLLYWEVEIDRRDAKAIHLYSFGVSPSIAGDHDFQADDVFWVVLKCDGIEGSINVKMMHRDQCLHEEVLIWCVKEYVNDYVRYGLMLDIDNRTLSVSYNHYRYIPGCVTVKICRNLFTFENVCMSKGITPIFKVIDSGTLSLVNPNPNQIECLKPLFLNFHP